MAQLHLFSRSPFSQPRIFSTHLSHILRRKPLRNSYLFRQPLSVRGMASSTRSSPELRNFPSTGFQVIDPLLLIEEESIPNYKAQRYYPVHIGEVLNERYQVVCKLGYGSSSTAWLCCDLREHQYIALKVYVNSSAVQRELPIYDHLNQFQSDHPGRPSVRLLLDSFKIAGPHGQHICLVHQPLGMSLLDMKIRARSKAFSKDLLKSCLRQVLLAVDYLHNAHVIHTDVQPSNILMGISDESVLSKLEEKEMEEPIPRKMANDRTIYISRPVPLTFGTPVLCNLGEARFGDKEHRDDIMPDVYRAPEVILGMKWDYKVDMWSVAMMAWHLFEVDPLFRGRNPEGEYDDGYHLAEMIAILGPPPLEFLKRTENSLRYWDDNGDWRGLVPIPELDLEQLERRLEGKDKAGFLQFVRRMLTWLPEERPTAEEVIYDPWLMGGFFPSEE